MCILLCGVSFGEILKMQNVCKTKLPKAGYFLWQISLILIFERKYEKIIAEPLFSGIYFFLNDLFILKYPNYNPDPSLLTSVSAVSH